MFSPHHRLRSTLALAAVLVLFSIATVLVALAYHRAQRRHLERTAAERLSAIAELKVGQIERWRQTLTSDALWIQESPHLRAIAQRILAEPGNADAQAEAELWMTSWMRHHACLHINLLSANLERHISVPRPDRQLGGVSRGAIAAALNDTSPSLGEMHRESPSDPVHLDVLIPLRPPGSQDSGKPLGILVLEMDLHARLFPTIQSWPTPSRSGETLLVRREGEEIVYLNELRHRTNTALQLRLPISLTNLPAVRAVTAEDGIVAGVDYRNRKVLAATARVPGSTWAVVSKEDLDEIHEPLTQLAWALGGVACVVLLAGTAGVGVIWMRRERRFALESLLEHKQSEEALRTNEERLRKLYASMSEMLVLHEVVLAPSGQAIDYRILDCNPAFERTIGISRERAVGSLASVVYGTGEAPYLEVFARVASSGQHEQFETYFPPMDRHFAIAVFSPQPGRFATLSSDITERKRHSQQLEQLLKDLQEKTRELESIIYVASHDLRSPLINIQGFASKLDQAWKDLLALVNRPGVPENVRAEAEQRLSPKFSQSLQFIRASSDKLNHLIRGLLLVSRAGRDSFQPRTVDMNPVVRSSLDSLQFQLQSVEAVVRATPLPPCAGDPQSLSQIVTNLLDNAIKYRDPARTLTIQITAISHAAEVEYCIEDNGIGIAPEHHEKIWELFRRLHPDTPSQGEGIGLNLVRRLTTRMHGRAWVTSTPGHGSCFHIALPAAKD